MANPHPTPTTADGSVEKERELSAAIAHSHTHARTDARRYIWPQLQLLFVLNRSCWIFLSNTGNNGQV